jgi:hypothetical protein
VGDPFAFFRPGDGHLLPPWKDIAGHPRLTLLHPIHFGIDHQFIVTLPSGEGYTALRIISEGNRFQSLLIVFAPRDSTG